MKRLALLVIAMMGLFFTSCKPEPENGDNNNGGNGEAGKVKVSCTIPINKGTRSDFSGLFEDGVINWSDGKEYVYLAIPGDEPKVVELKGYCDGYKPVIEFIAYVDENLLTAGESYDIWYFGHSQQLDEPYVSLVDGNKIEGSIAKQTGRLEDLGYSHIASTSVKAVMENGEVKLPLVGTLKNRMAIALLDLETVTELYGSAVNTDYTLEYNAETGKFEFKVIEDEDASIEVESAEGISYVAFLPNGNNEIELKYEYYGHASQYVFYNGIKENKIYHRLDENENMTYLTWNGGGYQYVDLGLPSGLKWATCNVGASFPYENGNYYAWGEVETKETYTTSNNVTDGLSISELQYQGYIDEEGNLTSQHDAATANWGGNWRMPTQAEMSELRSNCTWTWTTYNGVNGCNVKGPNGNSIFLPATGSRDGSSFSFVGSNGIYWSSTPYGSYSYSARLSFSSKDGSVHNESRRRGHSVRPVLE